MGLELVCLKSMKRSIVIGLSLFGVLMLYAFGMFGWEMYVQATRLPQAEKEMGVDLGTPDVNGREVIQFVQVDENGNAYAAGVRKGDILNQTSLSGFTNAYFDADQSFVFSILRGNQNIFITVEKSVQ